MPATDPQRGDDSAALDAILAEAREYGFLGPGPLEPQRRHAEGFARLARRQPIADPHPMTPRVLDLGSGGGLPGLVLALDWPEISLVLLDASARRTQFLTAAVARLGVGERVEVVQGRAEASGRLPAYRAQFDGVVARSFGPPATVAECAAPFLRRGGWLIVSEPPEEASAGPESRWPLQGLTPLGLVPGEAVHDEFGYQVLRQSELCPDRFPRRDGVPAKRPLF